MDNNGHNGDGKELPALEKPKRALVLSGGGARGAYQVGVLQALAELGIEFDMAFGTSVGGINAAFYAQGKLTELADIWCSISATDVFRLPTMNQLRHLLIGHRWGLLDTGPLEELLYREMDLEKFKSSRTKVGFITTDLCTLETRIISTADITSRRHLVDTLMASSALPILFPARHVNGEGFWIDGGLVRNTPMQAAINMGAKEIYIVLLQAENDGSCPTNILQVLSRCADILLYASARDGIRLLRQYNKIIETQGAESAIQHRLDVNVFQPGNQVNYTVLDINAANSKSLIKQGYEEAMHQITSKITQEQLFSLS
jgi:NTE family protein